MVVAYFTLFSKIGAMVLPISPKRIKLESCACAHIEVLEGENRWLYLKNAGNLSERGGNAATLISDGGAFFFSFFPNWFHSSASIS